jgi:hypothetical protein
MEIMEIMEIKGISQGGEIMEIKVAKEELEGKEEWVVKVGSEVQVDRRFLDIMILISIHQISNLHNFQILTEYEKPMTLKKFKHKLLKVPTFTTMIFQANHNKNHSNLQTAESV